MKISSSIKLTVLFAVLAILFLGTYAYADGNSPDAGSVSDRLFTESGIITGFGSASINEGDYETILLIWHLGIDLKKFFPKLETHKGKLSFYLEPQINPVVSPETDIECGIGLGFKYMYPITDKLFPYIMGGAGPHYISVNTKKQTNGFIFSNTIGVGFYCFLTDNSAINLGYRLRHMSNANLTKPNGGIDSHFGTIGYSIFF